MRPSSSLDASTDQNRCVVVPRSGIEGLLPERFGCLVPLSHNVLWKKENSCIRLPDGLLHLFVGIEFCKEIWVALPGTSERCVYRLPSWRQGGWFV